MTTKLKGGIGVLADHLRDLYTEAAGEIRYRTKAERILVENGHVTGVQLKDGSVITAPVVVSNLAPTPRCWIWWRRASSVIPGDAAGRS